MLQAFVDDSVSHDVVLVMGGVLATPERWKQFSDGWRERLNHAGWQRFKMREVWERGGDIPIEHAKWHYYTLRQYAQGAVTMVIPIKPLKRIAAEFDLERYSNPYMWGIKGIVNCTAQYQKEWGVHDPIDFIFDDRSEEDQVKEAWDFYLETIPEKVRNLTGQKPIFGSDDDFLQLQGADLWAWWARRKWLEKRTIQHDEFPIPWGELSDLPTMAFEWTEADMRQEFTAIRDCLQYMQS